MPWGAGTSRVDPTETCLSGYFLTISAEVTEKLAKIKIKTGFSFVFYKILNMLLLLYLVQVLKAILISPTLTL